MRKRCRWATKTGRGAIAVRLRESGLEVREGVGLSTFTVDLALRQPDEANYHTAVLVDTSARYRAGGLEEVLTARASLLEHFCWQVVTIPFKDWWKDPDRVIEVIKSATCHSPALSS
jgi:REase_MTES_1575